MLEVEVHPVQAMDENRERHGPEGVGNKRLASESTPVEQGQDFATSTGTLEREEMSDFPQGTVRISEKQIDHCSAFNIFAASL